MSSSQFIQYFTNTVPRIHLHSIFTFLCEKVYFCGLSANGHSDFNGFNISGRIIISRMFRVRVPNNFWDIQISWTIVVFYIDKNRRISCSKLTVNSTFSNRNGEIFFFWIFPHEWMSTLNVTNHRWMGVREKKSPHKQKYAKRKWNHSFLLENWFYSFAPYTEIRSHILCFGIYAVFIYFINVINIDVLKKNTTTIFFTFPGILCMNTRTNEYLFEFRNGTFLF